MPALGILTPTRCSFCAPQTVLSSVQAYATSPRVATCPRRGVQPRHFAATQHVFPRRTSWRASSAAPPPSDGPAPVGGSPCGDDDSRRPETNKQNNQSTGTPSDMSMNNNVSHSVAGNLNNPQASSENPAESPQPEDVKDQELDASPAEGLDMSELRRRMREVRANEKTKPDEEDEDVTVELAVAFDSDFLSDDEEPMDEETMRLLNDQFDKMDVLYVILFNSKSDTEGVYSLALNGVSIVLAFQEKSEARRYALMLEAQDFPAPHVGEFSAAELKEFCGESGYRLGLVPKGSLLTPPDDTMDGTLEDWSESPSSSSSSSRTRDSSTMDPEEIENMKRRLEGLFGES